MTEKIEFGVLSCRFPSGAENETSGWMVTHHMRRVYHLAGRYCRRLPRCVEFDDLAAAGMVGLVEARNRFVRSLGVRFSTFAEHRIRGAMLDFIRGQDHRIHIPLEAVFLCAQADENPGLAGTQEAWELMSALNSGSRVGARPPGDPFQLCLESEFSGAVAEAVARLPRRERLVVSLYYFDQLRMREIGKVLDLDRSRVSQLHASAIARLRKKLAGLDRATPPRPGSYAPRETASGGRRVSASGRAGLSGMP